jgi:hypothetical protein
MLARAARRFFFLSRVLALLVFVLRQFGFSRSDFFSTGFGVAHQISLCPVLLLGAHSDPAARRAPVLSPCSSFSVRSHRLYQVSVPCKSSPSLGPLLLDWFWYSVAASSSCFVSPIVASSWHFSLSSFGFHLLRLFE